MEMPVEGTSGGAEEIEAELESKVQRAKTTLALVQAYDALGINAKSVKSMPFEELAMSIESRAALEATKALFDRLERRLIRLTGSSSVENIDHLLKRLESQKRRAQPAGSGSSRYAPRVLFGAYMILAHPDVVLSGEGDQERLLMESAANFVKEFELLVNQVPSDAAGQSKFRTQLVNFDKAWCSYLYGFVVWKVKDAESLEGDLVKVACKLELSMMETCKLTADGPSDKLTDDMKAIQKQVTDDQKLLGEKVRQLSGDAGIERINSALSDTRSMFFEAKGSGRTGPTEASSPSSSTSPLKLPTENEQMVNEMLHENDGVFAGRSSDANTVQKDFQAKVREAMEKAFWDVVTDSMRGDKPDYSQLINLVKEVKDSLHELAPKGWKEEILETINLDILSQVLESGLQDSQYLGQIMQYSLDMVRKLSAPAKEDEMKRSHDRLLIELAASSQVNGSGMSSFVVDVIKGLRFTFEEIKELQTEVSKARIQLMQQIIKGSDGVEYLQKAFNDRYGTPADASASLPLTLQLISASKNVMGQEWNEHLDCLSVLPAAFNAQPIVPVVRAGHGHLAGQASSVRSAVSSGLTECKGEYVDKLIRIGLLQLVSGMVCLQPCSTPETFQLNLLRLMAVQVQFQQMIVIATSMLVLRQVLMGENTVTSPLILQDIISELYNALVKLLETSPEAGTDEIVEAMMSSSASAGSLSAEKMQARRQLITRVLLKSLQADDVVFKKVFRSVYCAFSSIVLGGSGVKGQKLADAALSRIGAAKLVEKVAKGAEVLIRVAAVSEKVHGPWYKALS